jgi:ADP-heptose:LPS heptosyltransferase
LPVLIVWGSQQERKLAETIAAGSAADARLAPSTTLRELAALAQPARIFVGSDTGPLHLAVAVGTPCVGLYGPWPAEENGPYGSSHVVLQKMAIHGPPSKRAFERRYASRKFMDSIDVPSVCAACDKILGGRIG